MKIVLFDKHFKRKKFLPLTYTRAIADLRFGMMTLSEKWQKQGFEVAIATEAYLAYSLNITDDEVCIFVDATVIPNERILASINQLEHNESIRTNDEVIAFRGAKGNLQNEDYDRFKSKDIDRSLLVMIDHISDLFTQNAEALKMDYALMTDGKQSSALDDTCTHIGSSLYLADGVTAKCAIFNTEEGPIYIDEGSHIMEGALLRGPIYIGKNAVVKMGAKIYGATTIGPYCKVGGEVSNSLLMGYSNKGHDGFLGNSIIGEWCNLGADTNTSNLKNNYGTIKTWSYTSEELINTGLIFHGLIMGDHAKSGINTMFNTGTTIGVCTNVYGSGFPDKFIASFSWGGKDGYVEHQLDKAIDTASKVYARRKKDWNDRDQNILRHIFSISKKYRT